MFKTRKRLGLAVTEQGLTAVEVITSAGRRTILQSVALPFSDTINLNEPEKLGKELKKVLRAGGVRASECVIGLAAAWIATREKTLPVTDPNSLRGVLSIAAEHDFASGPEGLSFDYTSSTSETGISALLIAAPRPIIEQLLTMAKAAGLSVLAITSSTAALALATRGTVSPTGRLILGLMPRGVELTVQSASGIRLIRHISARLDEPEGQVSLSAELRRILLLAPGQQGQEAPRELLVWNSADTDRSLLDLFERQLGTPVRLCTPKTDFDVSGAPSTPESTSFAQAVALVCSFGLPGATDFLHSRLTPRAVSRLTPRIRWLAAVACVPLAAVMYLLIDWGIMQHDVSTLQQQLITIKPAAQDAKALVDHVVFARSWYDHRPEFLGFLREITLAFPEEGRVWATGVIVREDMQALLSGKSTNESAALELLDRLKSSPKLTNVKPLFIRQAGGTSHDVSFAINVTLRRAD